MMLGETHDAASGWQTSAAAAAAVAATAADFTEAEQAGRTTWAGKHEINSSVAPHGMLLMLSMPPATTMEWLPTMIDCRVITVNAWVSSAL